RSPLRVRFYHHLPSAEARAKHRTRLRLTLAQALGVAKTGKMIRAIEQKRYVMTANLATKMLHLNARKRSGNNVILVGDTGQGKTEMVDFYSLFLNMDNDAIPDLLDDLTEMISRFIKFMYRTPLDKTVFDVARDKSRAGIIKLLVDMAHANRPVDPPVA